MPDAEKRNPTDRRAQKLTLHVRDRWGCEHCYPLLPDTSIGRAPENEISVDHHDLRWQHARVFLDRSGRTRLRTTDDRFSFTLLNGNDVRELVLNPGVEFRIGTAE